MEIHNKFPFKLKPGEVIGQGAESIVRSLGEDWAIKETNPSDLTRHPKEESLLEYQKSPKHLENAAADYRLVQGLLGNLVPPTYFVYGVCSDGERGGMIIQRKFEDPTSNERIQAIITSSSTPGLEIKAENADALLHIQGVREIVNLYRKDLLKLLWASKLCFQVLGIPLDLHTRNVLANQNAILLDLGSLHDLQQASGSSEINLRVKARKSIEERISSIRLWETILEVGPGELEAFNSGENQYAAESFEKQVARFRQQDRN
ncbi:MAG: hypothetical protein PHS44_01545 [Candidatus Dojkabacteria bacterium]|nr:hypothetical protein [Candidatus Dojkabacteria bacterium]